MFGQGVSKMGELIDLGIQAGAVEKSGAWLSYKGERLGQGRENAKLFLAENTPVAARLEAEIREKAREIEQKMLARRTQNAANTPDAAPRHGGPGKRAPSLRPERGQRGPSQARVRGGTPRPLRPPRLKTAPRRAKPPPSPLRGAGPGSSPPLPGPAP